MFAPPSAPPGGGRPPPPPGGAGAGGFVGGRPPPSPAGIGRDAPRNGGGGTGPAPKTDPDPAAAASLSVGPPPPVVSPAAAAAGFGAARDSNSGIGVGGGSHQASHQASHPHPAPPRHRALWGKPAGPASVFPGSPSVPVLPAAKKQRGGATPGSIRVNPMATPKVASVSTSTQMMPTSTSTSTSTSMPVGGHVNVSRRATPHPASGAALKAASTSAEEDRHRLGDLRGAADEGIARRRAELRRLAMRRGGSSRSLANARKAVAVAVTAGGERERGRPSNAPTPEAGPVPGSSPQDHPAAALHETTAVSFSTDTHPANHPSYAAPTAASVACRAPTEIVHPPTAVARRLEYDEVRRRRTKSKSPKRPGRHASTPMSPSRTKSAPRPRWDTSATPNPKTKPKLTTKPTAGKSPFGDARVASPKIVGIVGPTVLVPPLPGDLPKRTSALFGQIATVPIASPKLIAEEKAPTKTTPPATAVRSGDTTPVISNAAVPSDGEEQGGTSVPSITLSSSSHGHANLDITSLTRKLSGDVGGVADAAETGDGDAPPAEKGNEAVEEPDGGEVYQWLSGGGVKRKDDERNTTSDDRPVPVPTPSPTPAAALGKNRRALDALRICANSPSREGQNAGAGTTDPSSDDAVVNTNAVEKSGGEGGGTNNVVKLMKDLKRAAKEKRAALERVANLERELEAVHHRGGGGVESNGSPERLKKDGGGNNTVAGADADAASTSESELVEKFRNVLSQRGESAAAEWISRKIGGPSSRGSSRGRSRSRSRGDKQRSLSSAGGGLGGSGLLSSVVPSVAPRSRPGSRAGSPERGIGLDSSVGEGLLFGGNGGGGEMMMMGLNIGGAVIGATEGGANERGDNGDAPRKERTDPPRGKRIAAPLPARRGGTSDDGGDPGPEHLAAAAGSILNEYKSRLAAYFVRRPFCVAGEEGEGHKGGGDQNGAGGNEGEKRTSGNAATVSFADFAHLSSAAEYLTSAKPDNPESIEVVARIYADGSVFALSGKAHARHGRVKEDQGEEYDWNVFEDVENMDRSLGCVMYIDEAGNEREYWLDSIYEEALTTRESYCASMLSAAFALQAVGGSPSPPPADSPAPLKAAAIAVPAASEPPPQPRLAPGHNAPFSSRGQPPSTRFDAAPPTLGGGGGTGNGPTMMPTPAAAVDELKQPPRMPGDQSRPSSSAGTATKETGGGDVSDSKAKAKSKQETKKGPSSQEPELNPADEDFVDANNALASSFVSLFSLFFSMLWLLLVRLPIKVTFVALKVCIIAIVLGFLWLYLVNDGGAWEMGAGVDYEYNAPGIY